MNLKIVLFSIALSASSVLAEDYQTLTDQNGREIEAKILKLDSSGEKITVQRKGQRNNITVPISAFNEMTRSKIQHWACKTDFMNERLLIVDCKKIKKKGADQSSSYEDNKGDMSYSKNISYDYHFNITVENKSNHSFDGLSIRYTIYYTQEETKSTFVVTKPPNTGHMEFKTLQNEGTSHHDIAFNIPKKSKRELRSEKISLNITDRENAELHGIIIHISFVTEAGESITREIKYPEKLDHTWTTETKVVQATES